MLFLLSPLCICEPSWVRDKKKKEGMNEFWNRSDAVTMLNKEFGFKGLLYLSRNFVIYLIMGREKWVSCLKISEPLTLPFLYVKPYGGSWMARPYMGDTPKNSPPSKDQPTTIKASTHLGAANGSG